MLLLFSTSVMFSFVFTFSEKRGLTIFQNFLLSLTSLMLRFTVAQKCNVTLQITNFFYKSQLFSTNHNFFLQSTTLFSNIVTFFYKVQLFSPILRLFSTDHNFFLRYCDFFLQTTTFFYNIATFPKILRGLLPLNPGA